MDNVSIGLAFAAGLLSFISPCVLPLAPAYIGYMGGRLTHNVSRQVAGGSSSARLTLRLRMLLHGIAFVLGFTLVFVLIGLLTTALSSVAGAYVGAFTEILGRAGGLVIIFFGFQFMGVVPRLFSWLQGKRRAALLDSPLFSLAFAAAASMLIVWAFLGVALITLPLIAALLLAMTLKGAFTAPAPFWTSAFDRLQSMLYADTRADIDAGGRDGILGSAFMGVVFSAGWTPCIGPLLGTILTVAAAAGASSGDIARGMLLLTAYSFGLGLPFIITAALLDGAQGLLRRLRRHINKVELVSGSLLVCIGLLVASGQLQSLSRTFSRGEFADFTYRVEECGLGFLDGELGVSHVGACLSGALMPISINQSASGIFTQDRSQLEFVFLAEADAVIDIELRGISEAPPELELTLFSPDEAELARARSSESLMAEGNAYPLVARRLDAGGVYRIALMNASERPDAHIRVKVRHAEPIAVEEESPTLAGSLLGALTDLARNLTAAPGLAVGNRAPDFAVTTLAGERLGRDELSGKVVLLNFWGTWCGPCRREMPEFQKAYETWGERGFEILAIAYNDTTGAMSDFRDEFGLSFPLALDATGEINDAYAVQTRPSSWLLDADGVILARHFGMMTDSQLHEILSDAFAER